ncbi:hypothetical protein AQJ67_04555 [Streptomyces caeruleatus]|uniref:Transposase DDE domain-containing protein n=1 Tax=Streptomyces caeruleatus TaxID=661399 RepID=A0A101U8C1_9ACTN|nr:hypothetical protein AQJ67_04555 [Streptomyces caeruleatus]
MLRAEPAVFGPVASDPTLSRLLATDTADEAIAALEPRHRRRARAEDRIRAAHSTGLRNLPLHDTAQNQVWLEIVQIVLDPPAWMPLLALNGNARLREPRRLRLRLFSTAAQPVTTGRRRYLRLAKPHWPFTGMITGAPWTAPHPPEPRLNRTFPSLRAASAHRSRGTRCPPGAKAGH